MNEESDTTKEESEEVELVLDEEGGLPDLQAKIKKLKAAQAICDKERKEYLDGWQRAKADLINYRKDETKRFEELARFANEDLLQELIGVLDNFDLALAVALPPETERGIVLIRGQIEQILRRHGLEAIPTVVGNTFDPEKHESIGEEESDIAPGAIARVLQKGFAMRGRIIRPARVKLSKGQRV